MSLIFFLILLLGLYMQIKLLLRKHPQHISPMHTVQTNNQIACPQTGKSWLTYRDECPAEGGAAHNSRHRLQNKRAWNLRAQCELKWKESEEKGSHTWWNLVRWQSPSHSLLLLSRSLSGDRWCAPLLNLWTLLPETCCSRRPWGFFLKVLCSQRVCVTQWIKCSFIVIIIKKYGRVPARNTQASSDEVNVDKSVKSFKKSVKNLLFFHLQKLFLKYSFKAKTFIKILLLFR